MATQADKTRLGKLRVLVVDDKDMLLTLVPLLQDLGVQEIYRATDGQAAINLMTEKNGRIHLILCDANVRRLDGLGVLKSVRWHWGDIPFVMMTAQVTRRAIEAAREAGVSAYLAKPFNAASLEQRIMAVVRSGADAAAPPASPSAATDEAQSQDDSWMI